MRRIKYEPQIAQFFSTGVTFQSFPLKEQHNQYGAKAVVQCQYCSSADAMCTGTPCYPGIPSYSKYAN